LNENDHIDYVRIRNSILQKWFMNCTHYLTLDQAMNGNSKNSIALGTRVYTFLNRFGYINVGVLEKSSLPLPDTKKHIVVVGAGISGIVAAEKLQQLGYKVTVLEARMRTGGRMYTHYYANNGTAVDIGASIVTGSDTNPISTVLPKQTDIELFRIGDDGTLYDTNGDQIHATLDNKVEKEFNSILERCCALKKEDRSYHMLTEKTINELSLGHVMFSMIDEYLQTIEDVNERKVHKKLLYWHVANLEYGMGTDLRPCSIDHWDQDDEFDVTGSHYFVKQGYSSVINYLSRNLTIQLSQQVNRIDYKEDKVIVHTTNSDADVVNPIVCELNPYGVDLNPDQSFEESTKDYQSIDGTHVLDSQQIECDALLLTVPLGVLQKNTIQFNPPLPDWKSEAIQNLGFGVLSKLILRFPYVFWNDMAYFGNLHEDEEQRGDYYLFWNMNPCIKTPVLVALFAGNAAFELENLHLEDIVSDVMTKLRRIYGDHIPDPDYYMKTNWHNDPFATGTYSYVKIGGSGVDYDNMAKSVEDKIFFAGEATYRKHPSTVYGALMSGLREAGKIDYLFDKMETEIQQTAVSPGSEDVIYTGTTKKRKVKEVDLFKTLRVPKLPKPTIVEPEAKKRKVETELPKPTVTIPAIPPLAVKQLQESPSSLNCGTSSIAPCTPIGFVKRPPIKENNPPPSQQNWGSIPKHVAPPPTQYHPPNHPHAPQPQSHIHATHMYYVPHYPGFYHPPPPPYYTHPHPPTLYYYPAHGHPHHVPVYTPQQHLPPPPQHTYHHVPQFYNPPPAHHYIQHPPPQGTAPVPAVTQRRGVVDMNLMHIQFGFGSLPPRS
jgi:monoamine oxidase